MKTKGMLESEISQAIIKFEKDYMGRGPLETRTFLIEDMVLVRLRKVLTPAELKLAGDESASRRALSNKCGMNCSNTVVRFWKPRSPAFLTRK